MMIVVIIQCWKELSERRQITYFSNEPLSSGPGGKTQKTFVQGPGTGRLTSGLWYYCLCPLAVPASNPAFGEDRPLVSTLWVHANTGNIFSGQTGVIQNCRGERSQLPALTSPKHGNKSLCVYILFGHRSPLRISLSWFPANQLCQLGVVLPFGVWLTWGFRFDRLYCLLALGCGSWSLLWQALLTASQLRIGKQANDWQIQVAQGVVLEHAHLIRALGTSLWT